MIEIFLQNHLLKLIPCPLLIIHH